MTRAEKILGGSIFGECRFSVSGPSVWNNLPDYLRNPLMPVDILSTLSEDSSVCTLATFDATVHWKLCAYALNFVPMRYTNSLLS